MILKHQMGDDANLFTSFHIRGHLLGSKAVKLILNWEWSFSSVSYTEVLMLGVLNWNVFN